jgi:hypothetical protein
MIIFFTIISKKGIRFILICLLLTLTTTFLCGQVKALAGELTKIKLDTKPLGLLKSSTGNLLLVRSEYEEKLGPGEIERCAIDVYSPELKLIKQGIPKEIKRMDTDPETREWALQFGDTPSLMLAEIYGKEGRWDLFRAKISEDGIVGPQAKIGSLPGSYKFGELLTYFSCDSSLMMVLYAPPQLKYGKEPFSFILFDKNWNKVRSGTIELPFDKADLYYERPLLTVDGAIWIPFWTKNSRKGDIKHQIWVWRPGQKEPEQIDIPQGEEGLINSFRLVQSPYDSLIYGCDPAVM